MNCTKCKAEIEGKFGYVKYRTLTWTKNGVTATESTDYENPMCLKCLDLSDDVFVGYHTIEELEYYKPKKQEVDWEYIRGQKFTWLWGVDWKLV
jgi:hypothetical protein